MISGFLTSLSLILAIGAQNAFVLRQGLRREHVGTVVLLCALSDAVLISAGVAGFGAVAQAVPWLGQVMLYAGAGFLLVYGALRFKAAWQGTGALDPAGAAPVSRGRIVATCLALTWANPHVYLDTLVLIGSIAAQAENRVTFGAGAVLASFMFFTLLGYGARWLAPLFRKPAAWTLLEIAMGLLMWTLAAGLILDA